MFRIIMVCTGNICRSPMAAGLLQHLAPGDLKKMLEISSAGCNALHGNSAEPNAVAAMAQLGIDITHHRARQITATAARKADLVLTMEKAQRDMIRRMLVWKTSPVRLLTTFDPQSCQPEIEDPYGRSLQAYQSCILTLTPCIEGLIEWLTANIAQSAQDIH